MTKKNSLSIGLIGLLLVTCLVTVQFVSAQDGSAADKMSQQEIDRIISVFNSKETQFRKALNLYSFKRDAMIQSIGMGGQVTGEYHRISYFTFDDRGDRYEKISFFPMPSFVG